MFSFRNRKTCLFLDADGVLWPDCGPGTILDFPVISDGAKSLIKKFLVNKHHLVIVLTNQTAAARKLIDVQGLQELLRQTFKQVENQIQIEAVYSCFHHPAAENLELRKNCACRKPSPEMILKAAKRYKIDLSRSYLIGDRITDIKSASLARVSHTFLLVNSKMYEENIHSSHIEFDVSVPITFLPIHTLFEAQELICIK